MKGCEFATALPNEASHTATHVQARGDRETPEG